MNDGELALTLILKNYKEFVTGVYRGISDYNEGVAIHAIQSLIVAQTDAAQRELLERMDAASSKYQNHASSSDPTVQEVAQAHYDQGWNDAVRNFRQALPELQHLKSQESDKNHPQPIPVSREEYVALANDVAEIVDNEQKS